MNFMKRNDAGKKFDVKKKVLVVDDNENKTVLKLNIMKKSDAYKNMEKSDDDLSRKFYKKRKPIGYWNEETVIKELKNVINELGHFPKHAELQKMNKSDLTTAITKNGGYNNFREKLRYELLHKPKDYWTEEIIIKELKLIIKKIGNFPIRDELQKDRNDLIGAINKHGGINYFREKMGYELLHKPKDYWTEEIIIAELKLMIEELGHFPTRDELRKNKGDLDVAIGRNGGSNYFREKMRYELLRKSDGYWTEETVIKELKLLIKKLGHFPSISELRKMNRVDLTTVITRNGGINYFKEKCGFTILMQEKERSKKSSYVNKRGQESEQIVKDIINNWSINNNKSCPDFNVKLAPGNVIEFVCDSNKRIGIDVTNTKANKSSVYTAIQRKWKKKDYCLYLDELWIVVFTDVLTLEDYIKLNEKSPDNVKVFSIDDFLKELDYSTKYWNKDKIDRLNDCSFHTKDELINISEELKYFNKNVYDKINTDYFGYKLDWRSLGI